MTKKYSGIVVIGSVGFDVIMNLPAKFTDFILPDKLDKLNVSFTVNSLRREFGGTGGNCAYTMGLLGQNPTLVGRLGNDGEGYAKHLGDSGVKLDKLTMDRQLPSAVGHVMTDERGNQIWSYYPGPLNQLTEVGLPEIVRQHDLVALMPSNPAAFVKHLHEVIKMGNDYMFDPSFFIPNLNREELTLGISNAQIVIGNDYEIMMMEKKINLKLENWSQKQDTVVVKTLGAKGSVITWKDQIINVPVAKVAKVVDPTGAGDAYRAGFLTGFLQGQSLEVCGRMGAVAGAYCVENMGTQNHHFTVDEFSRRMSRK